MVRWTVRRLVVFDGESYLARPENAYLNAGWAFRCAERWRKRGIEMRVLQEPWPTTRDRIPAIDGQPPRGL